LVHARAVRIGGTGGLELGILGCGVIVPPAHHGGAITIREISGIGEPVYGRTWFGHLYRMILSSRDCTRRARRRSEVGKINVM
jgi:hypothetical protein